MKVIQTLTVGGNYGDPSSYIWVASEPGFSDIISELGKGAYAYLAYEGEGGIISRLGTIDAWLRLDRDTRILSNLAQDEHMLGSILTITDSMPSAFASFFDSTTLQRYPVTVDVAGCTLDLKFTLLSGMIFPAHEYQPLLIQLYDFKMQEATKHIDRWEDLVELGHATPNQKAFWGQWKKYRSDMRNWWEGVPGFDKEPVKPVATEPAPETSTATS